MVWRALLDQATQFGAERPPVWRRFCDFATALAGYPVGVSGEECARARLLTPHTVKIAEAADWAGFGAELGYATHEPPARARFREAAREANAIEDEIKAWLLAKLRAEDLVSEATDARHPMRGSGKIHPAVWLVDDDKVRIDYRNHTIDLGDGRVLRSVRVAPSSEAAKDQIRAETSRPAPITKIHEAIGQVYDDAEAKGEKPPNSDEVAKPAQELLKRQGYTASLAAITTLAMDERHKQRRLLPGTHFRKS